MRNDRYIKKIHQNKNASKREAIISGGAKVQGSHDT